MTKKERAAIAAILGSIRTPKKAKAARENGKLGGWKHHKKQRRTMRF